MVAMVDVGKLLVFVADRQMPVPGSIENLDRGRAVMGVTRIDGMRVIDDDVRMPVPVVAGCHDDDDAQTGAPTDVLLQEDPGDDGGGNGFEVEKQGHSSRRSTGGPPR